MPDPITQQVLEEIEKDISQIRARVYVLLGVFVQVGESKGSKGIEV